MKCLYPNVLVPNHPPPSPPQKKFWIPVPKVMLLSDSLLEEVMSCDWGLCKWNYCSLTSSLAIASSHCFAQHVNKWTQNDKSAMTTQKSALTRTQQWWRTDLRFVASRYELKACLLFMGNTACGCLLQQHK